MNTRTLTSELLLPGTPEEVFPFFADAGNLERITPPWLNFHLLTPGPIAMGAGTLIDYRLRLRGLPLRWRTLISEWQPPHRFVDCQIRGPYRLWRHEHTFEPRGGQTLCRDRVTYAHRGGPLLERLLVRPDLERIWAFRREALRRAFGVTFPLASPAARSQAAGTDHTGGKP